MNDLIYINKNSLSPELCNDMINMFELEEHRYQGCTINGVDKDVKDTTDFQLNNSNGSHWNNINRTLSKEINYNVKEYVVKNKVNDTYNLFQTECLSIEGMQIQKYEKNVGKYVYHQDSKCDFTNRKIRKLTFIWYLNDVTEGGETEIWSKYNIKPEAGKLVLFPANWTFPHTGKVPISNDKYIITGWLCKQYNIS